MKKTFAVLIAAALIITAVFCVQERRTPDEWIHTTFQGTVSEIWGSGETFRFALISRLNGNEYIFEVNEETLSTVDFVVGDEVVVECDYNIREHNGKDVPYPTALIADASLTDKG